MSNYNNLKTTIDANIKQNGNQEITGSILNSVLNQMVNILGTGYQFAGVAALDPATDPGTPDAKVFYIANGKGTYTNFGGIEVTEDDVVVLYWDSAWHKVSTGIATQAKLSELESNYVDISNKYPTGGIDGTDVYTLRGAREVAWNNGYRRKGTILSYKTVGGSVVEIFTKDPENGTQFIIESYWQRLTNDTIVNINREVGQEEAFPDAGSARYVLPEVYRKKGIIITYLLSSGWVIETMIADSWTLSVTGWKRLVENGYLVIDDKSIGTTKLADRSVTSAKIADNSVTLNHLSATIFDDKPISNSENIVKSGKMFDYLKHLSRFNKDCSFSNKVVPLGDYTSVNGCFDQNNGEFINHSQRRCIKEFIPVERLSVLDATIAEDCRLYAMMYSVNEFGEYEYIGYKNSVGTKLYFQIPSNVNAIRIAFYPISPKTIITEDDVNTSNFNIIASLGEYICKNTINIQEYKVVDINSNGGWAYGDNVVKFSTDLLCTKMPIKVTPGHRYAIDFNGSGYITDSIMYGGATMDTMDKELTFAYKEQKYISKVNNYTGTDKCVWIIPEGINYVRFFVTKSAEEFTPETATSMNAKFVDLTPSAFAHGGKFIPLHTQGQVDGKYSQGMCAYGDYIFQGYSTGEVEVLRISDKSYVGTFVLNAGQHLNWIGFGKKSDANDEFPLMWTGENGKIKAYKITKEGDNFTCELINDIDAPVVSDVKEQSWFVNEEKQELVAIKYKHPVYGNGKTGYGSLVFTKYSVSAFDASAVFTEVSSIDYPVDGVFPAQGGMIQDGKLYIVLGSHNTNARIYCFDFNKNGVISLIDLRCECFNFDWREEPQAICNFGGDLLVSGSYNIYKIVE